MITKDERGNLNINRTGETKTKRIGTILHNPEYKGSDEKRLPFAYMNGVCLTAEDCRQMAELLDNFA